jgi:hypothetical protein
MGITQLPGKKILLGALACLLLNVSFAQQKGSVLLPDDRPFDIGEKLELKISYGWFTIGKASVSIPRDTVFQNEESYVINVVGKTAGLLGFFNNTEDTFEAVINQSTLKPYIASQNFQEGKKRDVQTNTFLYNSNEVVVEKINYEKNITYKPKTYVLRNEAFDILSSYLYLRSIDFSTLTQTDSVMVKVFFGKKHWDFGIEYGGEEDVKTLFGKIKAHKFYILFPVTETFPEAKSVMVWTTRDENQLPLKVKAKLRFGQVTCELTDFQNLKVPMKQ